MQLFLTYLLHLFLWWASTLSVQPMLGQLLLTCFRWLSHVLGLDLMFSIPQGMNDNTENGKKLRDRIQQVSITMHVFEDDPSDISLTTKGYLHASLLWAFRFLAHGNFTDGMMVYSELKSVLEELQKLKDQHSAKRYLFSKTNTSTISELTSKVNSTLDELNVGEFASASVSCD